jgi:S-adenosylmethionine-diacylgycerolhomoserine-N-methlytransferase
MPASSSRSGPAQKMNRMYRWTRHVYDSTRRYYLLGRDRMLAQIADRPAGAVLEVGCGTARNLRVLDDQAPHHTLYGLDASLAMLATAREKLERAGCTGRVTLAQGLAQELRPKDQFGVDGPFDVIFFSYVLSMIPAWDAALAAALSHLAPNGRLYIVDFWDQAGLPPAVGTALRTWLGLFDVEPRPDLLRTLRTLAAEGRLSCSVVPVARRYAYLATIAHRDFPSGPDGAPASLGRGEPAPESKRFGSSEVIPA